MSDFIRKAAGTVEGLQEVDMLVLESSEGMEKAVREVRVQAGDSSGDTVTRGPGREEGTGDLS